MTESAKYAKIAYDALADKKGENIKIIDISGVSPMADYFIIADGANPNQLQAMCDAVDEALHEAGCQLKQTEGNRNSTWILMDYTDIIVHVFSREDRLFYDLERIWTDGKEISPDEL